MLNLVTDRTSEDVIRIQQIISKRKELRTEEEQAELASYSSKGAYNFTDLNRVISAMEYLVNFFGTYGYYVDYQVIITPSGTKYWSVNDKVSLESMNLYLKNLQELKNTVSLLKTTPELPSTMRFITIDVANNIEKILEDIELVVNSMRLVFLYPNIPWVNSGGPNYYFAQLQLPVFTQDNYRVVTSDGYLVFCK